MRGSALTFAQKITTLMADLQSRFHDRIELDRFDDSYAGVAERDYNHHSNVTSPFDVWSVCKLRSKCDLSEARLIPTDVVVWGGGSGSHIATTRVGGVPAWNSGEPLPSGLKFFGQFNLLDSADLLPVAPKGLLSVWATDDFPWDEGSVKTFWVDPDSAVLAPNFGAEQRFTEEDHEPYFGSLYRSYVSNKNKTQEGFPVVGWWMMNTVSKNQVQIPNIERAMTNLPLWQHLGWPSS